MNISNFIINLTSFFRYNKLEGEQTYRVVGFEVSPRSVALSAIAEKDGEQCKDDAIATANQQFLTPETTEIKFSYDVNWEVTVIVRQQ